MMNILPNIKHPLNAKCKGKKLPYTSPQEVCNIIDKLLDKRLLLLLV